MWSLCATSIAQTVMNFAAMARRRSSDIDREAGIAAALATAVAIVAIKSGYEDMPLVVIQTLREIAITPPEAA